MKPVKQSSRESVREDLTNIAERIQKETGASIPEVHKFLHEMIDVSV